MKIKDFASFNFSPLFYEPSAFCDKTDTGCYIVRRKKKKPKKIRGLFLAFRLRYAFQVLQQETTCSCKTEN